MNNNNKNDHSIIEMCGHVAVTNFNYPHVGVYMDNNG